MCTKEVKVTINNVQRSIWAAKSGYSVYCMDGRYCYICSNKKKNALVSHYTIETYAGVYTLTCDNTTKVLTDRGEVYISDLIVGDGLYVKGVFVKQKYTAIKKITKKTLSIANVYNLTISGSNYIFMNDVLVVTNQSKQNGD